ncbi:adenosylcobinamide-phosphate synthase [Halanaerobium congolense]|uniref:Cobalamin biosynthesis protein CobD n=1 Tax=Halanaerobium congolense TaxID=54121 RepID=A0A1I0BY18_9FIRM|nr:adenosylcobinamide-phosphate synthase CbiB [Halanaerobium congolense]PTX15373.1 adenosylcobinamide-phosphate synthase [Halanaerobium congolense]SDF86166.1 adenosylcobinamide-phosphate synthase [Halanaerobium congolense]SET12064.1 adenosylcobinamide-phosphate synthase [Halanaerobium congolense]SFP56821.1 adenosylcobinamide-phosphate synthase [Halanaerobium congolense]
MQLILFLVIALIIDLIISDPDWITHPVVIIGSLITFLEKYLQKEKDDALAAKLKGGFLVIIVLLVSYFISNYIIQQSLRLNEYFAYFIEIILLSLMLALKGLIKAGKEVYLALKINNLEQARKKVDLIVGRDCSQSSRQEVIRAVLETLAENTSDGILAPAFYYLLGGLPLAVTYKAVNTMDSMLGYKNDKYINFGYAAAKTDDFFNYIPARITAFLIIAASFLLDFDFKSAFKTVLNDAAKHPSPNAGYPEAAAAGALSLRFGGINYYQGKESFRAYIGQKKKKFEASDILKLNKIIYYTVGLFLILALIIFALI